MRKRPMCLACLGFMLVLVLLRIAGVPLGTPFSDPKYENKAQQGRKVWIAGTIETYEKKNIVLLPLHTENEKKTSRFHFLHTEQAPAIL